MKTKPFCRSDPLSINEQFNILQCRYRQDIFFNQM